MNNTQQSIAVRDQAPSSGALDPLPINRMPDMECGGTADAVFDALPSIMRIESLAHTLDGGAILNRATLHHRQASLCVEWVTQRVDSRLHRGGLVSIRPAAKTRCQGGATRIQHLSTVERPVPFVNLFDTLLPGWLKEPELAVRAANLWALLPRPLAHLINAVLWDSNRMHRFVTGPSSLVGHHNGFNGNFRHSIEVAENAHIQAQGNPVVSGSLLVAGGLLHDIGKAAEYRYDRQSKRFRLSDRGELIGHRNTLIEWLAIARETGGVILDDGTWLGLLHMLNAVRGAPDWIGLRNPRSLEADLLSMADRLSGSEDLHRRCAPPDNVTGFGRYHPHLGHRTYVTREVRP